MKVKVHIGRLTVEGASRADAIRAGEALRSRLTELVSKGFEPRPSQISRLDGGEVPHGANAEHIGRHTAGRIFQNLKGSIHG